MHVHLTECVPDILLCIRFRYFFPLVFFDKIKDAINSPGNIARALHTPTHTYTYYVYERPLDRVRYRTISLTIPKAYLLNFVRIAIYIYIYIHTPE